MNYASRLTSTLCGAFVAILLSACGGGSGGSNDETTETPSSRPILNKEVKAEEITSAADGSTFAKAQLVLILDEDSTADPKKICQIYGCSVVGAIPEAKTYQLEFQSNISIDILESIETKLNTEHGVSFAAKNYISKTSSLTSETGPGYMEQRWAHDQIELAGALKHLQESGKAKNLTNIAVGVIDSGFEQIPDRLTFDMLLGPTGEADAAAARPVNSESSNPDDINARAKAAGHYNHGEHVAGIIGARRDPENFADISGITNGTPIRLMAARTDFSIMSSLANFARLVRSGSRVINMSFGVSTRSEAAAYSRTYANLIQSLAASHDFLVAVAAGNSGVSAFDEGLVSHLFNPDWIHYSKYKSIQSRIIIVGALDGDGKFASYSNHGPAVELVAPGGGDQCGKFAYPFILGPGVYNQNLDWNTPWYVTSEYKDGTEARKACAKGSHRSVLSYGTGGKKIYLSGTSMAAPHVAGVAALIYSINPSLSANQVKRILLNSQKTVTDNNGNTYPTLDMKSAVIETSSSITPSQPDNSPASITIITRLRCKVDDTYTDITKAPLEIYLINNINENIGGPQLETDLNGIHSATILKSTLRSSGADTLVVYIPRSPANKVPSNPPINRGFTLDNLETGPSVRTIDIVIKSKSIAECGTASSGDISISTTSVASSDRQFSPVGEAFVISAAPTSASIGAPTAFTISGQNLPLTAVMAIQDATCQAPTNNTATGFTQVCTPGGTAGSKTVTVKTNTAANGGVVISDSFTVQVSGVPAPTPSLALDFDAASISAIGATGSNYTLITGKDNHPAIKFSGVGNPGSLRVPNTAAIQFTSGFSYDMWVRIDSDTGMDMWGGTKVGTDWAMSLLAKSHDRTGTALLMGWNRSTWLAGVGSDSTSVCTTLLENPVIPQGSWFRVTIAASATDGIQYYTNKTLIRTCPNARPDFSAMNTQDLFIGKFSDYWYPMNGAMQDLRIYKKALTTAEVQSLQ